MIELRSQYDQKGRQFAQDMIFADGSLVGFVGHHKGAKIMLIRSVSEVEQIEIEARVMAKFGADAYTANAPQVVPEPARMPMPEPDEPEEEEVDFDG